MSDTSRQLTEILDHQAGEIDSIGNRAENVAGTVASILPDIRGAVMQLEETGNSVLGTAEDLVNRSQWLVARYRAISPISNAARSKSAF